jgi:hypothetical protein
VGWQVSTLKQQELPDIFVAAGEDCAYLERFRYLLREVPSKGVLFCEDDRPKIKVCKPPNSSIVMMMYCDDDVL